MKILSQSFLGFFSYVFEVTRIAMLPLLAAVISCFVEVMHCIFFCGFTWRAGERCRKSQIIKQKNIKSRAEAAAAKMAPRSLLQRSALAPGRKTWPEGSPRGGEGPKKRSARQSKNFYRSQRHNHHLYKARRART